MARQIKRAGVIEDPDDAVEAADGPADGDAEQEDSKPKQKPVAAGLPVVLSGWCMTGYHRPTATSAGCPEVMTYSICPCPCHKAPDDPRYASPPPPHRVDPAA